jgi:iron complex transport system ATP-binding protein
MSVLRLADVTARRSGRVVLRDIGVAFAPGELTAVIGPNGAGKSTLLEVTAGLLVPDTGQVLLDETPLAAIGRRALAKRRAYLPQQPAIDWPISVERAVALGLTPSLPAFGSLPTALAEAVRRTLDDFALTALCDRPATQLSGGERARVMLARAVVGDPAVVIVDEPIAGLDPRHALDALARLRARAAAGRTVVMAIHELDLALRFADRVVAIRDGAIVAADTVASVLTPALLGHLYDVPADITDTASGPVLRFLDR